MTSYVLCLVLFAVGIYSVATKRHLIRIIVGLVIAETAVNLLFVLVAYKEGGQAPIISPPSTALPPGGMVDPLPHALVLTSIVIGLATTALLLAIAMRLYEKYGTFDVSEIRELQG